jgi:hypothetical protein
MRFTYEFGPSVVNPPPASNGASLWEKGITIDVAACARLGMQPRFCQMLAQGADIMLEAPLPTGPPLANYPSLESSFCSRSEAEQRLMLHVEQGFAELVVNQPALVHPLGAVPATGDKRFRLIMDCTASGLNGCIRKTDMGLPTIRDVMRAGKRGYYAAKFDLADGFFHIKVAPQFADLLGFRMPLSGGWARYRVLVFGMKCSPFFFCGTMAELLRIVGAHGVQATKLVYVDDWIMIDSSAQAVKTSMDRFTELLGTMSFRLAHHKTAGPVQQIEYSGHVLDFANARVQIKQSRCTKLAQDISELLEASRTGGGFVPYSTLNSLTGKLVHVQFTLQGSRAALAHLHRAKAVARDNWPNPLGKAPRHAKVALSSGTREALSWWRLKLLADSPPAAQLFTFADETMDFWDTDSVFNPWAPPLPQGRPLVIITTDASSVGYGIVVGRGPQFSHAWAGSWSLRQAIATSNFKEHKAQLLALQMVDKAGLLAAQPAGHPLFVLLRTDNTCAVAASTKLVSPAAGIEQVTGELRAFLRTKPHVRLASVHVPGIENGVADYLSRLAEPAYASRTLSREAVQFALQAGEVPCERVWGVKALGLTTVQEAEGRDQIEGASVLWVPPPHRTEEFIKKAAAAVRVHGLPQLVLLPSLPGQVVGHAPPPPPSGDQQAASIRYHRWLKLLRKLKAVSVTAVGARNFTSRKPVFIEDTFVCGPYWPQLLSPPIRVACREPGAWTVWRLVHKGNAGSTV